MTGGSPSLPRSRRMVVFTAVVNGSAASSQARSSSSSAETTRPAEASRHSSTANSFGLSVQSPPGPERHPAAGVEGQVTALAASAAAPGGAASEGPDRATSSGKSNGLGR